MRRPFALALVFLTAARLPGAPEEAGGSPGITSRQLEARRAVQEVLASPEFEGMREGEGGWAKVLLKKIGEALDAVERFFATLPPWLQYFLMSWLTLALVAILAHLIYTLVKTVRGGAAAGGRGRAAREGGPEAILGIRDLDFDSVLGRARELASGGRWREATKHLYVATILHLSRSGRIGFLSSKTNRDYVEELAAWPRGQALFARATALFEGVVYGEGDASRETCGELDLTLEGLRGPP